MTGQHIVFVGAGPRTAMILERITANREQFPSGPLTVHVVDPYPAGAGRIWREDQSPLLKLNSRAADVSVFTDSSVQCSGPAVDGPSLAQWVQLIRSGQLPDVPALLRPGADAALAAEVQSLAPEDFPTRRLQSCYLSWFFERVAASFSLPDQLLVHRDTVLDIVQEGSQASVLLASGEQISAHQVVLAQGHVDARLDAEPAALHFASQAADRPQLGYYAPGYTNDIDFTDIPAGATMLVSGMGLAFTDLFVLLFEGRGGRFREQDDGTLHYLPSGREPRLLAGSRRGVPYHSKIASSASVHPGTPARYLTEQAIEQLAEQHGKLDFLRHLWPLIAKEAGHWYYRELFQSHPERTTGSYESFLAIFDTLGWYSLQRTELVATLIPDPAHRLEFESLDAPLVGIGPNLPGRTIDQASLADWNERVAQHIREDLQLRDSTSHSELQALFLGLLKIQMQLPQILPLHLLTDAGRQQISGWWQGFFSFMDSGPPAHRLRELLALHEAGMVSFLGPEVEFTFDQQVEQFRAQTRAGQVHARWLIEARLPSPTVGSTANQLLSALHTKHIIAQEPGGTGKVRVNEQQQIISKDGTVRRWIYAVGAGIAGFNSGAFSRPHVNAAPFAQNDALARSLLSAAADMDSWELAGSIAETHRLLG